MQAPGTLTVLPPGFDPQPPGDATPLRVHGVEQFHKLHVFPPSAPALQGLGQAKRKYYLHVIDKPDRARPNFLLASPPSFPPTSLGGELYFLANRNLFKTLEIRPKVCGSKPN